MATSYQYEPITDISEADHGSASKELPALAEVWTEQRAQLMADNALREFNSRLKREWAIETGIIEQVYTLDRGTTELLIEKGIDASLISHDATDQEPDLVVAMIRDQEEAVDWLFEYVADRRDLSESFIKELHALMTTHQQSTRAVDQFGRSVDVELRRGSYKVRHNNPKRQDGTIHEYAPPLQVHPEMNHLVAMHATHNSADVRPEVEAAWLHHRFTQIHPFQDGNGRVARALASLVFLRVGWFPLVITRDDRKDYIEALESADEGDLAPLVVLFAAIQRKAFVSALSIAREVRREEERVEQVIDAIGDLFRTRDEPLSREFDHAKDLASEAFSVATIRFEEIRKQLEVAIHHAGRKRYTFRDEAQPSDDERRQWHRWQIVESARRLRYYANIRDFSAWQRLAIVTESGRSEILLSFHAIGHEYRGLIGASLSFYRRQGDEERQVVDHETVCDELLQINYKEEEEVLVDRFRHWLDRGLVRALEVWRRGE